MLAAQNQTAHEVTRDVTAWACQLVPSVSTRLATDFTPMCFADLWSRADAVGKLLPAWARLGPLSMSCSLRIGSHRRLPATFVVAAAHPRLGWRSGFPTGRPWDFALATIGLALSSHAWPCRAMLTISRTFAPTSNPAPHTTRGQ